MKSPSRIFSVLNLFSEEVPLWHTDDINQELGFTRATGYRYIKELVEVGLLQKVAPGVYSLGARVIEMDYQIRRSDPVLVVSPPILARLVQKTGIDAVLSCMYGTNLIDTYRSYRSTADPIELLYGRGRPRPLFIGGAPKIIMSYLSRSRLLKLYELHRAEIADKGLGDSWSAFLATLSEIRKQGYYFSRNEVMENITAVAFPVFNSEKEIVASVASVGWNDEVDDAIKKGLLAEIQAATTAIKEELATGHALRKGSPRVMLRKN